MSVIASEIVGSNQPGADAQADTSSNFDFGSLHEKAMNFGADAQNTPAPQEQVVEPDATAVPEPEPTNVDNASAAQIAQLKDDDLVEVTVNGEQVQLPWKEAKGGIMRQQQFTREMQSLRAREKQFESQQGATATLQQERDAAIQLLQSKELLRQFAQQMHPELFGGGQPTINPEDIATVGQVNSRVEQVLADLETKLESRIGQATQTIEDRLAAAKIGSQINETIEGLFNEHPYIKSIIPRAEDMLRYEVLQLAPSTPQETLEAFKQVFGGWVEGYKASVQQTTKQNVVQKQKLLATNIQPSGGTPPQPAPQQFFNASSGKLDWAAMTATAKAMLKD